MAIAKPGRVLLHNVPLKFVHDRVAGGGRKGVDAAIALVPFIDFLIVLVVFLLTSFGNEQVITQVDGMKMPQATNVVNLETAPIITISRDLVLLEGKQMANVSDLKANAAVERIEQLVQTLEAQKRNWSIMHAGDVFPGTVILQSDQETDFRVIKKVMFSAAQAGYANVSFAVDKRGKEGGGGG